uniref:Acyl-coenzyme A oxidase N-terminal domain-containing protein n=1 Tax=Globisporangium ultimum (strain ATCC 200006 / CBS 805.95 / DAOM BR144) TaxID=431595 RepID=K3WP95_GLOUD
MTAVELKDLAPLLFKKERAGGDLDAAQLCLVTNLLRGEHTRTGCDWLKTYAQTELGHGSNIQELETTARFDKERRSSLPIHQLKQVASGGFEGSAKPQHTPSCMHDHQPLSGIEVSDIDPQVSFNAIDNGYCTFGIPRDSMLMRYVKVLPDGNFAKPEMDKWCT